MGHLYLIGAIFFEIIATTALKYAAGFTQLIPSIITLSGYVASFYLLSLSLRTLPIGYTYAVWSAVGIISLAAIGALFMNEKIDLPGVIGMSFIVIGVVILSGFSNMSDH